MNANIVMLLEKVWGIPETGTDRRWNKRCIPYLQHYKDVLASSLIDDLDAGQLSQIIQILRQHDLATTTITELVRYLRAQPFRWLNSSLEEAVIVHAIELAVKLWLFTTTNLRRKTDASLGRCLADVFSLAFENEFQDDIHRLSDDFCAKSLERRGGFSIHWTSEISEHLTCVNKKVIKVFRHHSAIQSYIENDEGLERSLFPDDLLSEVDRTFYLLFPYEGTKAVKRTFQESEKRQIDLVEAGWADDAIGEFSRLQLRTYPRFGNRLAEIQRRYDAAKPTHPKQWWYDRRQRMEWAALMIAVMVLFLTIITLVTSILQVYAAFRTQPVAHS